MSLQINDPTPGRIAGSGATLGGLILVALAGFTGVGALIGVIAVCAGVTLVAGASRGALGPRQAGVFLLLGIGLGSWGLLVALLLWGLGPPVEGPPLLILIAWAPTVLAGAMLVRGGGCSMGGGSGCGITAGRAGSKPGEQREPPGPRDRVTARMEESTLGP
jgi:hypothetical protein